MVRQTDDAVRRTREYKPSSTTVVLTVVLIGVTCPAYCVAITVATVILPRREGGTTTWVAYTKRGDQGGGGLYLCRGEAWALDRVRERALGC